MRTRLLMLLLATLRSGCGLLQPQPEPVPEPIPEPEPIPQPQPEPVKPPPRPAPTPVPEPAPAPEPEPFKVAVVVSRRSSAYMDVSDALASLLDDVEVYDLSDRSLLPHEAFAAIHATEAGAVVAIGLRAAVFAQKYSELPIIFSQVFYLFLVNFVRA